MSLKTKVLYLVSLAAFLRTFAQVIYVPSLAIMRSDLRTTTVMIGLTLSVYGLFLAGALQFFARFAGATVAPTLGGYLADHLGMPGGYGLAAVLLALSAVIAYFAISNPLQISEAIAE